MPAAGPTLLDLLLDEPSVARCLVGEDGTVVRANADWLRLTGRTLAEVVGASAADQLPELAEPLARARRGGPASVQGSAAWHGRVDPVTWRGGTAFLVTARPAARAGAPEGGAEEAPRDVVRRVERALGEAEEKYRSLLDSIDEGFCVVEVLFDGDRPVDYRFLEANPAFEKQTGLAGAVGRRARELVPSLEAHWFELYGRVATTGEPARFERPADALGRTFHVQAFRVGDPAQRRVALLFDDVTARRKAEDALRESEARYRTLFTNMAEGFALGEAICDDDGTARDFRLLEMNEAFEAQSGLAAAAVRGRPMREVLPGLERSWIETYCDVAGGGPPRRFESYNRDLDRHFGVYCFSPAPGRFAILFSDVTDRRRSEEAVRESEARFRHLADAMPQLVWTARPDGAVDYYNERVKELSGARRREDGTWSWDAVLHPDDRQPTIDAWERAVRTGERYEIAHRVMRADGTLHWYLSRGVPVRDAAGRIVKWYGTATDIDAQKSAEAALREADRRKTEFLGLLSHELRNPLAPIANSLFVLERVGATGPQATRAREVMGRQVAHLERLVDDLLDVTRIERGKVDLRRTDLDLGELARRAGEDHRALMQAAGVELELDLPRTPAIVNGDAARLTQVVGNLLSNAAKFTARGGRVVLSLRREGEAAAIRVRDTGAGMPAELLPRVFEPFVQGEQTLARTDGGLGLGLALVKGLAELHGGEVRAESPGRGGGSEFTVRLPLAGRVETPAREDARPPEAAPRRRRVLVVDDNRDAAESLAELVGLFGHEVEVAYDGPSAVDRVRAGRPDVVLCDLGLPGMSGFEVARTVRAAHDGGVRLIAVSGYAQPEDVKASADAGFDAHVAKPPDPDRLERLLG